MKWLVALYTGLPYKLDSDEEDAYLLRPAVDIIKSHAVLTAQQIAYLDKYTIEIEIRSEPIEYNLSTVESQSKEEVDRKSENAVTKEMKWSWRARQLLQTY